MLTYSLIFLFVLVTGYPVLTLSTSLMESRGWGALGGFLLFAVWLLGNLFLVFWSLEREGARAARERQQQQEAEKRRHADERRRLEGNRRTREPGHSRSTSHWDSSGRGGDYSAGSYSGGGGGGCGGGGGD